MVRRWILVLEYHCRDSDFRIQITTRSGVFVPKREKNSLSNLHSLSFTCLELIDISLVHDLFEPIWSLPRETELRVVASTWLPSLRNTTVTTAIRAQGQRPTPWKCALAREQVRAIFSSTTSALVLQCSQEFHALLFVHVCAILTYWPWNAWNANVNASLKQLIYTEESSFLCRASNCISLYPEFQFQINSKSCWLHCDLWRPRMWFLEHPGHKLWKMSSQANRIHRSLGQNESLVFFGFGR